MAVGRRGSLGERQCLSAAPYLQLDEEACFSGWILGGRLPRAPFKEDTVQWDRSPAVSWSLCLPDSYCSGEKQT